ncbi:MAG: polysaccharide biosynthesis transport protein [Alphaproteobacteria bacterium]|jgi:capsular exopolysaccharide synthesis family protein|nr:polysaccharide biosynthesis transport protein [Alphaproteobacteria bacterium]
MLNRISPTSKFETGEDEHRFDLREILSFAWRQWKFIAGVMGVVFVVGLVLLMRQTPVYTATSLVLLDRQREKAPGAEAILTEVNLDFAMVESQMAIIRSSVFLRRVVEKERLFADSEFGTRTATGPSFLGSIRSMIFGRSAPAEDTKPAEPDEAAAAREMQRSIEALKGSVSVGRAGQGYVLAISVNSTDPARAARLANAVADAFLVDKLDARFEAAKRASAWLSDRLVELRNQLRESEEQVAQFRSQNNLFQSGNVTLSQQQLSELNAKLLDAKADAAQKKARVDLLTSIQSKGGSLQNMPEVSGAGSLPTLRQQAVTLSQQEAELLARYGAPHPLVVNVRAQQRDVERAIAAEMQRLAASTRNEYELARSRVASLEQSLQDASGQRSVDDTTAIRLRELERTAAVNKSLFEDFLQRAKITQEQSTFEAREARVINPAVAPGAPSFPRKSQYLAINLLIGLLLGVGGAVAKEMLNVGFTTPKQVEDILGLPLLSSLSLMGARDLTVDGKAIPIYYCPMAKPLSRYSEGIRALRSGVQMTDVDNPPKVIQVTSTVPGEGKTTIALSLAASGANSGLKVLLIDADLRHPSASRALNLEKDTGLVDLLMGQVSPKDVIRFHEKAGFWALAVGSKTQNPTDLLGSERMKSLVASFRQTFDLVIIDTSPAGPVIDPVIVSQLSDTIVMVVRWASTAREMVKHSVQQLSVHRKIAGVAFNQVNDHRAQKYGKYGYSYYYGARYYKRYYSG